jgi:hypothetical protein
MTKLEKNNLKYAINWLDNWIERSEDYLPKFICEKCYSKNVTEDSDGLEDTPDSHLGHSWLECNNCNADSDKGDKFFHCRDELTGISQMLENILKNDKL